MLIKLSKIRDHNFILSDRVKMQLNAIGPGPIVSPFGNEYIILSGRLDVAVAKMQLHSEIECHIVESEAAENVIFTIQPLEPHDNNPNQSDSTVQR
jgi:hypothetical protein